jgi:putative flippase GtrA
MYRLGKRGSELSIYFIGAFAATACNSISQAFFLTRLCDDGSTVCRLVAIVAAVAISFSVKFAWDSLLVFKQSRASNIKKGFFFLLSSALITAAYLAIMFAIATAGASNKALIMTGWILFGLGYLVKYAIDKRYAFDT